MCDLTQGKDKLCRNGFSGIYGAILGELSNIDTIEASGGVVTDMTMKNGTQAFLFKVQDGTSNFDDNMTNSRPNGTVTVMQTLLLSNLDYETATRNTAMELSEVELFAVVLYKNGKRKLAGVSIDKATGDIDLDLSGGFMLDTANAASGVQKSDKAGDDWSFTAEENVKAFTISKEISDSLLDYVS